MLPRLARLLCLLPLLAPCPTAQPAPPPCQAGEATGSTGSLQDLLRRAREERARVFAQLGPRVADVVAKLEALGRPQPASELEKLQAELDGLGPEAAPLLLPHLEPGPASSEPARFRASQVAAALCRRPSGAITEQLVELASSAGVDGRVHAIRVLGCSPDRERAGAVLRDLFGSSSGKLRAATIEALARLGGPEHLELLSSALPHGDTDTRRSVLRALAGAKAEAAAPAVLSLVRDRPAAVQVLEDVTAYYAACPAAAGSEALEALADLATDRSAPVGVRVALLDAMSRFAKELAPGLRSELEPLLDGDVVELREATMVLFAVLGDRTARRDLIAGYDDLIEENPRYGPAYEQRGDVLVRLGEHGSAAEDYRRSIEILQRDARFVPKDVWIKLARAYAEDGKARQAYEALRDAQLAPLQLRALRGDPAFQDVVAHARYGKIFE